MHSTEGALRTARAPAKRRVASSCWRLDSVQSNHSNQGLPGLTPISQHSLQPAHASPTLAGCAVLPTSTPTMLAGNQLHRRLAVWLRHLPTTAHRWEAAPVVATHLVQSRRHGDDGGFVGLKHEVGGVRVGGLVVGAGRGRRGGSRGAGAVACSLGLFVTFACATTTPYSIRVL